MSSRFVIKLLIIFFILGAAFFLYRSIFVSSPSPADTPGLQAVGDSSGQSESSVVVEDEFIRLLERLQNVKLDSSLFGSPAWESLINFRVELVPEHKGRRNPFLSADLDSPLPVSTTTASSSASRRR